MLLYSLPMRKRDIDTQRGGGGGNWLVTYLILLPHYSGLVRDVTDTLSLLVRKWPQSRSCFCDFQASIFFKGKTAVSLFLFLFLLFHFYR